jgi:hypothetical protein
VRQTCNVACAQRIAGKPQGVVSDDQPDAREGQVGRLGVAERFAVPLKPGNAGTSDFLCAFQQRHAFRFDTSAAHNEEALEVVASLVDWIKDLDGIWDDCSMSEQLRYARGFLEQSTQLEAFGLVCYMGHHRQLLRQKDHADLVFNVGLLSIQSKEGATGRRYALVQLEGNWETTKEDRVVLPKDF